MANLPTFRPATSADSVTLAELHTLSWRTAYRDILAPRFLERDVFPNRLRRWRSRLEPSTPDGMLVLLAHLDLELAGFICVDLDAEPAWGALVDNLHVHPASHGHGLGRALLSRAARWVAHRRPGMPLHLWAFEANLPARAFYEHLGGLAVERKFCPAPDGADLPEIHYQWPDPAILLSSSPTD